MSKRGKGLRIKTMFGFVIPPRKAVEASTDCTLEFVLPGWIPSKKNMQVPTFNKKYVLQQLRDLRATKQLKFSMIIKLILDIKCYIRTPTKVVKWQEEAKAEILFQAQYWKGVFEAKGLVYPISRCTIHIRYCWADQHRRDNSNKSEAIHDILVSSGIITDDSYTCLHKNSAEAACYSGELTTHVTQVFITVYKW